MNAIHCPTRPTRAPAIKRAYWRARAALLRRLDPASKSLSPHPWLAGVERAVRARPNNHAPVVCVDGGAHDGRVARQIVRRLGGAGDRVEVHAFEPNADLLPRLHETLANTPGSINAMALGPACTKATMNVNASPMTSSLLEPGALSRTYFSYDTALAERRPVAVTTLDEWCEQRSVERIDVLKLDLQGYELEALRGAAAMLGRGIACIYLEVSFAPFYAGGALFAEIDTYLRDHGYQLYNLYHLCTHLPDGHVGSADALYVPATSSVLARLNSQAPRRLAA